MPSQRNVMAVAKFNDFSAANKGRSYEEVICELESRVVLLEAFVRWDEELRKQNPALQDLFEKYQITKKLIGTE